MTAEIRKVRASTIWKKKHSDAVAAATGVRFCMSCRTTRPAETVKRYRGAKYSVVLRCDECQARRLECLRNSKEARRAAQ